MRQVGGPTKWGRCILLLLLVVLALGVRILRARQLPVVAPDAIRYIEQGKMLLVDPVRAVREEVYHPLFSLAVVGVHAGVKWMFHMTEQGEWGARLQWIWAGQAISMSCGALMAALIFALARQLGGRFWTSLAAGVIWAVGQRVSAYSVDGMSDMLALCSFAGSMLAACRAMAFRRRPGIAELRLTGRAAGWCVLAGFLAGLAYLTRPEGLAAPAIVVATMAIGWLGRGRPAAARGPFLIPEKGSRFKWIPRCRPALGSVSGAIVLMMVAAAAPALPYMVAIRGITHKKQFFPPADASAQPAVPMQQGIDAAGAVGLATEDKNAALWVWEEVCRTFGYAPMVLLLLPTLWHRRLWGRARLRLLVLVWAVVWYGVMFWLLLSYRYLNGRHTLPLNILGFALLGIALQHWTWPMRMWMNLWQHRPPLGLRFGPWSRWRGWPGSFVALVWMVVVVISLSQLSMPPWAPSEMLSHAAQWVRENMREDVLVCDKQLLVGYYAVHPYARWYGEPSDPHMDELQNIRAARRVRTGREPLVVLGRLFERGKGMSLTLGQYRAVAIFEENPSDVAGATDQDLYVLYALPGEQVFKDGRPVVYLASWHGKTGEANR